MDVNDLFPAIHAVSVIGRILNYDAGLGNVVYELAATIVLTVMLFLFGIWVFTRRHMRADA